MANSYVQYLGNGVTTQYSVPFAFLSQSHVTLLIDGVDTAFSWASSGTINIIPAPASGAVITIRRETPLDDPLTDFTNGQVILEEGLDQLALVDLYRAQEIFDRALMQNGVGVFDAANRRITGVGSPVEPSDAVSKTWAESGMTSQLQQAAAQVALATQAAEDAEAAAIEAANLISSFTISTNPPSGGKEGDVWFLVSTV